MDILIRLRDLYINFVCSLPEGITSYVLRISILLLLAGGLLGIVWDRYFENRSVFLQACLAFLIIVISMYFPVEIFRESSREYLAFSVAAGILCMIFLPGQLPRYLAPRLGNQMRLKKIIRNIVWGLFILQLIVR